LDFNFLDEDQEEEEEEDESEQEDQGSRFDGLERRTIGNSDSLQSNALEGRHPEAEVGEQPLQPKLLKFDMKSNDARKQLEEL